VSRPVTITERWRDCDSDHGAALVVSRIQIPSLLYVRAELSDASVARSSEESQMNQSPANPASGVGRMLFDEPLIQPVVAIEPSLNTVGIAATAFEWSDGVLEEMVHELPRADSSSQFLTHELICIEHPDTDGPSITRRKRAVTDVPFLDVDQPTAVQRIQSNQRCPGASLT
jgi:hypothetical protein